MLRFDKATYLSHFFRFILFVRLNLLLYTFLVTSFSRYKGYIIYLISCSKFSVVLPAFACTRTIGNL